MNILCLEAHVPLGFPVATVWQAQPALANRATAYVLCKVYTVLTLMPGMWGSSSALQLA